MLNPIHFPVSNGTQLACEILVKCVSMKPTKLLLLATTIVCLSSTLAFAGDHDKKSHKKDSKHDNADKASASFEAKPEFLITTKEKAIIQTWYKTNPLNDSKSKDTANLPPGLAKKVARGGKLPPGWQKKVCRGETIPSDVYEHCQPIPPEVSIKLPVPPVGTILVRVEGKIARILEATHEILDVFDVLPKPAFPKSLPGT